MGKEIFYGDFALFKTLLNDSYLRPLNFISYCESTIYDENEKSFVGNFQNYEA
jgi:hypothetical protein